MRNNDKITLSFGQLKRLIKENSSQTAELIVDIENIEWAENNSNLPTTLKNYRYKWNNCYVTEDEYWYMYDYGWDEKLDEEYYEIISEDIAYELEVEYESDLKNFDITFKSFRWLFNSGKESKPIKLSNF